MCGFSKQAQRIVRCTQSGGGHHRRSPKSLRKTALWPADEAAYLLVVMEVHGQGIQPFGYEDRVDFLVAMDDAIVHINLSNIELLAVEEFLPAAGPAAESLLNLYGDNGVLTRQTPAPAASAPSARVAAQTLAEQAASPRAAQPRASGRKLLQMLPRSSAGALPLTCRHSPVVSWPSVHCTSLGDTLACSLCASMHRTAPT